MVKGQHKGSRARRSFALGILVAALAVAAGFAAEAPGESGGTDFVEEEVRWEAPDGITLAGVLLVPVGEGPFPGAVILQGSGDSDRTNYWARSHAEAMARVGVATLLPDKRGTGASEGDWSTASFETLARDALAAAELVRNHPKVDGEKVGLVGLSQGGHVAPLAAHLAADVAFVVDVSGGAITMVEQIRHEMANTAHQAGLSPEGVETVLEIQRLAEEYVRTGAWEPYAAALERAAGTEAATIAEGFPQTRDSPVWTWARLNGEFDPIPHWKALDAPVLIAYGEEDEEDNVPVAESVRRLRAAFEEAGLEDWTVRVFTGSGHGLWDPDSDPHHPELRDDWVELLTGWIRERTGD